MDTPNLNGKAAVYSDPPSVTFGKEKKCQWLWFLWFYAGAVSAALIVLAVVGSIHLKEVKKECDCKEVCSPRNVSDPGKWQNIDMDKIGVMKNLFSGPTTPALGASVNVIANKEMIKGDNGSLTLLDFNKHRLVIFDGERDVCLVNDQLSENTANVTQLMDMLDNPKLMENSTVEEVAYEVGDYLRDKTVIPLELDWMCQGRDAYIMYKMLAETGRKKKSHVQEVNPKGCTQICTPGPSYCCRRGWLWRCKEYCHETKCRTFCT